MTLNSLLSVLRPLARVKGGGAGASYSETQLLLIGRLAAEALRSRSSIVSLRDVEFKVFSQFGDDGIIQWLTHNLDIPNRTFVEFGVEDYRESNTRFLLMNDNWSGMVIDGSPANVSKIVNAEYFWRYQLIAKAVFIDRENINALLSTSGMEPELGILSVDLDGNDYWIWEAISGVSPIILILEYNSVFGIDRAITVPYDPGFQRNKAHHSNLYWGSSLRALYELCARKGYALVGCNSAGNNAYFVRHNKLNAIVREVPIVSAYVASKFRESRDPAGRLTYLGGADRIAPIRGLPVVNVIENKTETL
jgi:hypothetical protein